MFQLLLVDEGAAAGPGLAVRLQRTAELGLIGPAPTIDRAGELLRSTRVDIILVDSHHSPGDFEVCRRLRALTQAPIVILASIMTTERWSRAKQAGATAYVLKTIDTTALINELRHILCDASSRNH